MLTGATGFVGQRLLLGLATGWRVVPVARRPEDTRTVPLDLAKPDSIARAFDLVAPAAVVHTGAIADPDACQHEPELAHRVNVEAVKVLAKLCAKAKSRLVHFSTDLVFDGESSMYGENDPTRPLSVYGHGKLESERAAFDSCPESIVLRVSNCYGRPLGGGRPSFVEQMHADLTAGRAVKAFVDQWRTATAADQLPEVLLRILANPALQGVYHWGGADRATRYDAALVFCQVMGHDERLVRPSSAADIPFAAPRPRDTSLDSSRLGAALGMRPVGLREGYAALKEAWSTRID
jgi:dTDP-4-dehydrorhamnose reductase